MKEMEINEKLFTKFIRLHSLVEVCGDPDDVRICADKFEIVDDVLYFNEDPQDDIELRHITKIWNLNEDGNYMLAWERSNNNDII